MMRKLTAYKIGYTMFIVKRWCVKCWYRVLGEVKIGKRNAESGRFVLSVESVHPWASVILTREVGEARPSPGPAAWASSVVFDQEGAGPPPPIDSDLRDEDRGLRGTWGGKALLSYFDILIFRYFEG